jgi:hypothetical protein
VSAALKILRPAKSLARPTDIHRCVNRWLKPCGCLEAAEQAQQYDQRPKRGASGEVVILVEIGFLKPAPSAFLIEFVESVPLERVGWYAVQYFTLSSSNSG